MVDDASPQEGTRWAMDTAVSANAVRSYFVPIRATGVISVTVEKLLDHADRELHSEASMTFMRRLAMLRASALNHNARATIKKPLASQR